MQARCRRTGARIVATLERLYGRARLNPDGFSRSPNGGITHEAGGEGTDLDWNSAETVLRNGQQVYIDQEGDEVLAAGVELYGPEEPGGGDGPRSPAPSSPSGEKPADGERPGYLIAVEGIDQAGKATQAAGLRRCAKELGRRATVFRFPDYNTRIGALIGFALDRADYSPGVIQMLCAANRLETGGEIQDCMDAGDIVICDRYVASGLAYGRASGLDAAWLESLQAPMPAADWTILLDVNPATAEERKRDKRDRYELDRALLTQARQAYLDLASANTTWTVMNAAKRPETTAAQLAAELEARIGRRPQATPHAQA